MRPAPRARADRIEKGKPIMVTIKEREELNVLLARRMPARAAIGERLMTVKSLMTGRFICVVPVTTCTSGPSTDLRTARQRAVTIGGWRMAPLVVRRRKIRPASSAPVRGPEPGPAKDKALIRSLARGFTRTGQARPIEAATGDLREPAACTRCGAVFGRRVWRRDRPPSLALLDRVRWTTCPGCAEVGAKAGPRTAGYGRA
jgi:hypothetical protein